jgi:kinesin family protein 23
LRLKTENSAIAATLNQERERIKILEGKLMRYETSIDTLNRKIRDKDEYIAQMEQDLNVKQHLIDRKEHEKERQRRKFDSKLAEETGRKEREMEVKLSEQKRKLADKMRSQEEKLRLVTDIINSEDVRSGPVSNLIDRFNANCENVQQPQQHPASERKARPRVSFKYLLNINNFLSSTI